MTRLGVIAVATAVAASIVPSDAVACGGCFAPVGQPAVVTAHRMAVSLSTSGTTLWDQIQYAGAPEDFVWVLPIKGTMAVELADNAFFEALDLASRVTLEPSFPPVAPFCADPCDPRASAGGCGVGMICLDAGAGSASDASVTVFHEGSVGPYETATIGSADPGALLTWLGDHGYAVPAEIAPTITYYVDNGFNFAALRLAPNAGVQQMQPVRVTTPGLGLTFPLRMVGAGVSESVALELYVIAEGRYETRNFPTVEIDRDAIYWDWATRTYNYDVLFDAAVGGDGGRTWVVELALHAPGSIAAYTSVDPDGTVHSSREDWMVATRGIASAPYVTKLRTSLAARFLDQDILLGAASGGDVPSAIVVTRELNRPPPCPTVCLPRSDDVVGWPGGTRLGSSRRGDGLCGISRARADSRFELLALALCALAVAVRTRRPR